MKIIACLALTVALAAAAPLTESEYATKWIQFKTDFEKAYEAVEDAARYLTFKGNVDFIDEHNARSEEHGYQVGMNQFGDMSSAEFKNVMLTYKAENKKPNPVKVFDTSSLADSVDWVSKGAVTPVKNQGQCGSCWAFSTTGSTEGAYQIATGKLLSFSEQELVDCAGSYGNQGCNGGLMDDGFKYLEAKGDALETTYSYTGKDGTCSASKSSSPSLKKGSVTSFNDVQTDSEPQMMAAVSKGPVSVAIEADQSGFQFYKSGVFSGACGSNLDHGVLVVGYGTDSGKDYWKVKNSWGTTWGQAGYILLTRGANTTENGRKLLGGGGGGGAAGECGLLKQPSYPVVSSGGYEAEISEEQKAFVEEETTHLKDFIALARENPEEAAKAIAESPLAQIISNETFTEPKEFNLNGSSTMPIVVAHGMGDSCFNPGMKQITENAGKHVGVYSTCIPTAGSQIMDTIDGFLKNMDKSVEYFAQKVKADPKLANGFDAFGVSQGNNVIRGYITKYNNPPVRNFMSICGINAGVGAFPACSPQIPVVGGVCKALTEVLGALAYNPLSQGILFQADYFRDPSRVNASSYLKNSQLAKWNNEGEVNQEYKANWAKTSKFVWVKGTEDTVVWPREGEWWGAMSEVSGEEFKVVKEMKDTRWYADDLFGLKTADTAGKNHFESFVGQHIRFTEDELYGWLDKYFKD